MSGDQNAEVDLPKTTNPILSEETALNKDVNPMYVFDTQQDDANTFDISEVQKFEKLNHAISMY